MARFDRLEVWGEMLRIGLVPLFYHPDAEVAFQVTRACWAGGARVVEFTHRGDFALEVFGELSRRTSREMPEVILGVGSVIDSPTAALYMASGANFIVSPVFCESVARLSNRHKVAYIPGCATPSEISAAEEMGVEIIKVFPAHGIGGPDFVRAMRGPCPWVRLMPTGGIEATQESIRSWFQAGAACIGMGSDLIRREWVETGNWDAIAELVRRVLTWIQQARRYSAG